MSFSHTTLGAVRGPTEFRRDKEHKLLALANLRHSTLSSRRRNGERGELSAQEARELTALKNLRRKQQQQAGAAYSPGASIEASLSSHGINAQGQSESDVPADGPRPAAEDGEEEEEEELPELSNFVKMQAERSANERQERKKKVDSRLRLFGYALDTVELEMTGARHWSDRTVKVKLLRGKDLPICDVRKSDPYCKLTIGRSTKSSSVIRSNLNPVWNEHFTFKVAGAGGGDAIRIDVYDQDLLPAEFNDDGDDHMGGFEVSLLEGDVELDAPARAWHPLVGGDLKDIKGKKQEQRGQVGRPLSPALEHCAPATVELEITVSHANSSLTTTKNGLRSFPTAVSTHKPPVWGHGGGAAKAVGPDEIRMGDDAKRMLLVSHVGRLRHANADMRSQAVQALAKSAGPKGAYLPKSGGWPSLIVKNLSDLALKDTVSEVRWMATLGVAGKGAVSQACGDAILESPTHALVSASKVLDALNGLVAAIPPGDPEAVRTCAMAVKDVHRDVRHAAIMAMPQLAHSGDEKAIFSVAERLEDSDHKVRESVAKVLSKLSTEHDQRLVQQVLLRLSSIHSVVRTVAVQTLVTVAPPGTQEVIAGIEKSLKDPDEQVRIAAMRVLPSQVSRGQEPTLSLVLDLLHDSAPDVRTAAAYCVSEVAIPRDKRVVAQLCELMGDSSTDLYGHSLVPLAALKAVRVVSGQGEEGPVSPRTRGQATDGALKCLKEKDWMVRKAACEVLSTVASDGNTKVLERLVNTLQDSHPQVRKAASHALYRLVQLDDTWLNASLSCLLVSRGAEVRSVVAGLLQLHIIRLLESQNKLNPYHKASLLSSPSARSRPVPVGWTSPDVGSPASPNRRLNSPSNRYKTLASSPTNGSPHVRSPISKKLASNFPGEGAGGRRYLGDGGDGGPGQKPVLKWGDMGGGVNSPNGFWDESLYASMGGWTPGIDSSFGSDGGSSEASSWRVTGNSPTVRSRKGSIWSEAGGGFKEKTEEKWEWTIQFLRNLKHGRVCSLSEAVDVLKSAVGVGSEGALEGLLWSMNSSDPDVRKTAITALKHLTPVGHKSVVSALQLQLQHPDPIFRKDASLALSLVAKHDDPAVIKSILALLEDPVLEVRCGVEQATRNMLYPGDERIVIANASVRLMAEPKAERQAAVEELGNLAYMSSEIKLQGFGVEDSDMQSFWNAIRMPKEEELDKVTLLKKIMGLMKDEDAGVRRSAIRASIQCGDKDDPRLLENLIGMLHDRSFTVRVVATKALCDYSEPGDVLALDLLIQQLEDDSHLVRHITVVEMHRMVKVGDRTTGGKLLKWLRNSWRHRETRGDDIEVKHELSKVIVQAMGESMKESYCIAFCDGMLSRSLHASRNSIARFEDKMKEMGLQEPGHLARHYQMASVVRKVSYTDAHIWAVIQIQRWAKALALLRVMDFYRKKVERTKDKYKKTPQEKVLAKKGKKGQQPFIKEEDQMAMKAVRNRVPEQIRHAAITMAHEKTLAGEDDMDLWDRMRWTERLRLCEEIAGHSF